MTVFRWMKAHRIWCWGLLILLVAVSALGALRLRYKEDITDFLPVDADYRRSLAVYQDIAGGSKIAVAFTLAGGDGSASADSLLPAAMEAYVATLHRLDAEHWFDGLTARVGEDDILGVMDFCYAHLPLLLRPGELDAAALGDTAFLRARLTRSYEILTSQTGSVAGDFIDADPLGLFAPVGDRLRAFRPAMAMHLHDGYAFSADGSRSYISFESPFGNSETDRNGSLVALLQEVCDSVALTVPAVECHALGAPVVAVGNARLIRRDSVLALAIASVLILLALIRRFRDLRPLLSIVATTGFGFLFALGCLGWTLDSLSVIVLGIASMLIGIAANYPLHYECHLQEEGDAARTLRDLVTPLVIGNLTTIGAFLTLVPLSAVALRQLGLFAALMLAGTILFTVVWLPQMRTRPTGSARQQSDADSAPASRHPGRFGWSVPVFLIAGTLVLGWFSMHTEFDSDFTHINYMSPEIRADMERFAAEQGQDGGVQVYAVLTGDSAGPAAGRLTWLLDSLQRTGEVTSLHNPALLLPDAGEQQRRLEAWRAVWQTCGFIGADGEHSFGWYRMMDIARGIGFSSEAFGGFRTLLTDSLTLLAAEDFAPLTSTVLSRYVGDGNMLLQATVLRENVAGVEEALRSVSSGNLLVFDQPSLNARIANALTGSFNWIGFLCGAIVFLFLWASFRRLEIALIAFLPMVIGWIWILGLMRIFGIQFNIVNIILATFIFGQGDDYTIFVTEGLIRDYRTGRHTSASFLRSIRLSAFIMLAGMGALVLAEHPAMHSLGQITLIGMFVVFVMAIVVPPLLFRLFLRRKPFKTWMDR